MSNGGEGIYVRSPHGQTSTNSNTLTDPVTSIKYHGRHSSLPISIRAITDEHDLVGTVVDSRPLYSSEQIYRPPEPSAWRGQNLPQRQEPMVDGCLPISHSSPQTVIPLASTTISPIGFTPQTTQQPNFRSPSCIFPGVASPRVAQSAATQEEFQSGRIHLSSQTFNEVAIPEFYNPYYHTLPGRSANFFQTGILSEQSFIATRHPRLRCQENSATGGSKTDSTPSSSVSGPTEHVLPGRRRKQRVICEWDGCQRTMTRGSLMRHRTEVHLGKKRKSAPHNSVPE